MRALPPGLPLRPSRGRGGLAERVGGGRRGKEQRAERVRPARAALHPRSPRSLPPSPAALAPGEPAAWAWSPAAASECGAAPLRDEELQELLAGRWVAVLGDSVARLFYAQLVVAAAAPGGAAVSGGHRDFAHALRGGGRAAFRWAPFESNVSAQLEAFGSAAPDVLVLGASLWHLLHEAEGAEGEAQLLRLRAAALRLRAAAAGARPLLFWQSTSRLVVGKLNSARKREVLTPARVAAHDAAAARLLLAPRGPCLPLDVAGVTGGCGAACTEDGMHYSNATYRVLLQQWANALRAARAFEARQGRGRRRLG